jgi:hypothetical protein
VTLPDNYGSWREVWLTGRILGDDYFIRRSVWTSPPADTDFLHGLANSCCTGKTPPNLPPLSTNTHTRSNGRDLLRWRRFHLLYLLPLLSQFRRDRYRKSGPFWNVNEPSKIYDLPLNLNRNSNYQLTYVPRFSRICTERVLERICEYCTLVTKL